MICYSLYEMSIDYLNIVELCIDDCLLDVLVQVQMLFYCIVTITTENFGSK